jgi:osmotically-inducible protein OsmY
MRNLKNVTVTVVLFLAFGALALANTPRGVDARIATRVSKILKTHSEYADVHFQVEDAVVTLTGSVKLASSRNALRDAVEALSEVAAVHTNIVLEPPPPPDDVLLARVRSRLRSMNVPPMKIVAHDGMVTISGSVADHHARDMVTTLVASTEGVREVVAQIRVEAER